MRKQTNFDEVLAHYFLSVQLQFFGVIPDEPSRIFRSPKIHRVRLQPRPYLIFRHFVTDIKYATIHTCSETSSRNRRIRLIRKHTQEQNNSACHIFAEKIARPTNNRILLTPS